MVATYTPSPTPQPNTRFPVLWHVYVCVCECVTEFFLLWLAVTRRKMINEQRRSELNVAERSQHPPTAARQTDHAHTPVRPLVWQAEEELDGTGETICHRVA